MVEENRKGGGTFISARLSMESARQLHEWIEDSGIPHPIPINELHCTLAFDLSKEVRYDPISYDPPRRINPKTYQIDFLGPPDEPVLVLKFEDEWFQERHRELHEKYGLTHRFPRYITHVSLSYHPGNATTKLEPPDFPLEFDLEVAEESDQTPKDDEPSETITEGVSSILYHYSSLHSLDAILHSNQIGLTTSFGTGSDHGHFGNRMYFLSTARSRIGAYHTPVYKEGNGDVLLVLDGDQFKRDGYTGGPVDYWGSTMAKDEMEDRIVSDHPSIAPASKYIREIHLLIRGKDDYNGMTYRTTVNAAAQAKRLGIPMYIYNDAKAFNLLDKRRAVVDPTKLKVRPRVRPLPDGVEGDPGWSPSHRRPFSGWNELLDRPVTTPRTSVSNREYKLVRYHPYDAVNSLSADIHNHKSPRDNHMVRGFLSRVKKLGLNTPREVIDYLRKKWDPLDEAYDRTVSARGKNVEVFKNPSWAETWEIAQDSYQEVRTFLVGDDALVWPATSILHAEVANDYKLPRIVIPVVISMNSGREASIMVTDYSRTTTWHHDGGVDGEILNHPWIRRTFRGEITISYYDEDVYGPWKDLRESQEWSEIVNDEPVKKTKKPSPPRVLIDQNLEKLGLRENYDSDEHNRFWFDANTNELIWLSGEEDHHVQMVYYYPDRFGYGSSLQGTPFFDIKRQEANGELDSYEVADYLVDHTGELARWMATQGWVRGGITEENQQTIRISVEGTTRAILGAVHALSEEGLVVAEMYVDLVDQNFHGRFSGNRLEFFLRTGRVPSQMVSESLIDDIDDYDTGKFWYHPGTRRILHTPTTHYDAAMDNLDDPDLRMNSNASEEEKWKHTQEVDGILYRKGWARVVFNRSDRILFIQSDGLSEAHKTAVDLASVGLPFQALVVDPSTTVGDIQGPELKGDRLEFFLRTGRVPSQMVQEEVLPSVHTPPPDWIAQHFNVPVEHILKQLEKGIRAEHEHTTDSKLAREIALDHLLERPDYYDRLEDMEKLPVEESTAPEEYRGKHTAPSRASGDSPIYDVTLNGTYPDDIYGPDADRMYAAGEPYDGVAIALIKSLRNRPGRGVKVYRAVPRTENEADHLATLEKHMAAYLKRNTLPPGVSISGSEWYNRASAERERLRGLPVTQKSKLQINPGDWVTTIRAYAVEHGKSNLGGKYTILSKTVPASALYTDGNSVHEFGYDPSGLTEETRLDEVTRPPLHVAVDKLINAGYDMIGEGHFALVFQKPGAPYVVKLYDAEDICYTSYLDMVMRNQDKPYFPKIYGKPIDIIPGSYRAVRMEVLTERDVEAQLLIDHINPLIRGTTTLSGEWSDRLMDWLNQHYPTVPEMIQVVRGFMRSHPEMNRCGFDLHEGNLMFRGSEPVLSDPVVEHDYGPGLARHGYNKYTGTFPTSSMTEARVPLRITPTMIRWAKSVKCQVIVEMPCEDFLALTTVDQAHVDLIKQSAKPILAYNRWAKMGDRPEYSKFVNQGKTWSDEGYEHGMTMMPYLRIQLTAPGQGRVITHEGRHRTAATLKTGQKTVMVALALLPTDDMFPNIFSDSVRYLLTQDNIPHTLRGENGIALLPTDSWEVIDGDIQKDARERLLRTMKMQKAG